MAMHTNIALHTYRSITHIYAYSYPAVNCARMYTSPNKKHTWHITEKDRLAIAIRSLRCVTIVSLTQVLVLCVVGVWLVVLTSSSILYGKVTRLIVITLVCIFLEVVFLDTVCASKTFGITKWYSRKLNERITLSNFEYLSNQNRISKDKTV